MLINVNLKGFGYGLEYLFSSSSDSLLIDYDFPPRFYIRFMTIAADEQTIITVDGQQPKLDFGLSTSLKIARVH